MNIKFISYGGEFPNLCSGQLVLNIDGKDIRFNSKLYDWNAKQGVDYDYPKFWRSGGCVKNDAEWNMWAESGPWELDIEELPDFLKPYAEELINIFNENVPYGCCGGCI